MPTFNPRYCIFQQSFVDQSFQMSDARVATPAQNAPNVARCMAMIDVEALYLRLAETAQLAPVDGLQLLHLCIVEFVCLLSPQSARFEVSGVGASFLHRSQKCFFSNNYQVFICATFV